MTIKGTTLVECPACGRTSPCELIQSINTRTEPAAKQRLLLGELNTLVCDCGRRTQLAARVLFHDPDRDFYCVVVPGGDQAQDEAERLFDAVGNTVGTQRVVPSLNALIEKVKILDADLADGPVEMTKVLLLASLPEPDLDRVLLFERAEPPDADAPGVLRWLMFDVRGEEPSLLSSPLAAYERLTHSPHAQPRPGQRRIDRAWAVEAVRAMIAGAN